MRPEHTGGAGQAGRTAGGGGHGGGGHGGGGHGEERAAARHAGRIGMTLALTLGLLVAEGVTAVATRSLALLSDAGHMLADAIGLAMTLAAIHLASNAASDPGHHAPRPPGTDVTQRRRTSHGEQGEQLPPIPPAPLGPPNQQGQHRHGRSFGLYRMEILAALGNAVLLLGVAAYVVFEAIARLDNPPAVPATPLLAVAGAALVVNLLGFTLLRRGATESINVRAAYLDVLADAVGSAGVLVAAAVIAITGWRWVDPVAGAALGAWIVPRALRLGRDASRILLQAAPAHLDLEQIYADLAALPDVVDVHDLHVWTLTSEMDVASAHLMVGAGADTHAVLDQARSVLADRHHVTHATLQVEPDDHTGCDQVTW